MEPGRTALAARDLRDTVPVGPLEVDRAPVTNERYAAFVGDTGHRPPRFWPGGVCPPALARHPVVGVDFFDAIAFALWAGGALPTELEWVEATGLPEHRTFAWGDHWDKTFCNTAPAGLEGTSPVGSHPQGTAPSGCVDMCGNVWEMTCSTHPGDETSVIVKGGSWYDSPEHAQIDARFRVGVTKRLNTVGFRLIYGRPPRFPEFLDPHLAARGIGQRQAGEDPPVSELDEFQRAFAELQAELRDSVADLDLSAFGNQVDAVDEALAMLDQAGAPGATATPPAPAPTALPTVPAPRSGWGRLKASLRHLRAADFWGRLVPAYRALRSHRPERTAGQRLGAALNALRHAHKGARLRNALRALKASSRERTLGARFLEALQTLWRPRGGPGLLRSLRAAVAALEPVRAVRSGWTNVRGLAKRRPRLLIASFIVAIGAVAVFLATSAIESPWLQRRSGVEVLETAPAPEEEAEAEWPEGSAALFTPGAARINDALTEIAEGGPERREEAERFLISRREQSRPRVAAALQESELTPAARASLRYVLATIEELRSRGSLRAQLVREPPRRGLVVFCRRFGPRTVEVIHAARRTGKAEGLPVMIVLVKGNERTMSAHARHLRNARVLLDRRGHFAQRLRVTHTPAVVGLDREGRRRFLLTDPISRARLADGVARLKR